MGKIFNLYINLQDKNLDLSFLKGKKFIISLCPVSLNNLTEQDIKLISGFLKSGCMLGQRGNFGICRYKHELTEPWHENVCMHNPSLTFEEQFDFMSRGKYALEKIFGKVEIYCPISHLYDINTIKVAQVLKYGYFMDLNLQGLVPYENSGLIILPEIKGMDKEQKIGDIVYSSYEDLTNNEIKDFIKNNDFILPTEIKIGKSEGHLLIINEIKKKIRKLEKDLKKLKEKHNID
jgi:hypothetical protein